ncbi:hypothetical protein J2X46_003176 [Nocardioides sp. BE266]|nr:hypothetical protein [Nocardioides sp. BE266]MDR7254183.1 hypothetical protein [Nocardioides sp. BE266]
MNRRRRAWWSPACGGTSVQVGSDQGRHAADPSESEELLGLGT